MPVAGFSDTFLLEPRKIPNLETIQATSDQVIDLAYSKSATSVVSLLFSFDPEELNPQAPEPLLIRTNFMEYLRDVDLTKNQGIVSSGVLISLDKDQKPLAPRPIKVVSILQKYTGDLGLVLELLKPAEEIILTGPRVREFSQRSLQEPSLTKTFTLVHKPPAPPTPPSSLLPSTPMYILGVTSLSDLYQPTTQTTLVLLSNYPNPVATTCSDPTKPRVWPGDYLKSVLIPDFLKKRPAEVLDIFIDREYPPVSPLHYQSCLDAGGPGKKGNELVCTNYGLEQIDQLFRSCVGKSRVKCPQEYQGHIRFQYFDLRRNPGTNWPNLVRLLQEIYLYQGAFRYYKLKGASGEFDPQVIKLANTLGDPSAAALARGRLQTITAEALRILDDTLRDPTTLIYRYQRELGAVEDTTVRRSIDGFVKHQITDIGGDLRNKIATISQGSTMTDKWLDTLVSVNTSDLRDLLSQLDTTVVTGYTLPRMLRSYTRFLKKGPQAKNILLIGEAPVTGNIEWFVVNVLGFGMRRKVESNVMGKDFACVSTEVGK